MSVLSVRFGSSFAAFEAFRFSGFFFFFFYFFGSAGLFTIVKNSIFTVSSKVLS